MDLQLPQIIAHRGAPRLAPENTIAAFKKAVESGAQWIECDVQLTQDGVPIIFHDFTLDRTTDGKGRVDKHRFCEIQKLDAGAWFSPDNVGERIPTLETFLHFAGDHHIGINLELKSQSGQEKALAQSVLDCLKKNWKGQNNCLISSFNQDALTAVREFNIDIPLGFNCDYWDLRFISLAKKIACYSIHIDQSSVNRTVIEECKTNFLKVLTYTVNEVQRAKQLLELGVSSVFSDLPDLL